MVAHVITLDPDTALAAGLERVVYPHPTQSDRLIKVIRPWQPELYDRWRMGDITKRMSRYAYLRPMAKEIAEYNRLVLSLGSTAQIPLAHLYGYAETSEGLGMVTERIGHATGDGLGETLADLLQDDALDEAQLAALNAFVTQLYALDVRAGDLSAPNFVWGRRPGDDTPRWVLVDGFGDRHAVPVRSLGGWANRLGLDDCFKRMAPRIPLTWDNRARQFRR